MSPAGVVVGGDGADARVDADGTLEVLDLVVQLAVARVQLAVARLGERVGRRLGPGERCASNAGGCRFIQETRVQIAVDDVAGNGPSRYCSPRRRVP